MFAIQSIFIGTTISIRMLTILACQSSQLGPPIPAFPAQDGPIHREKLFASASRKQSGNNGKDENNLFSETLEFLTSSNSTTTLAPSLIVSTKMACNTGYVIALTNQPYDEQTHQADYTALMTKVTHMKQKLSLLETFLRVKLSSFGQHIIQPINENGTFALQILYSNVAGGCEPMQDFAAKTVSYSNEVEKAIFNCKCGDIWMIEKLH